MSEMSLKFFWTQYCRNVPEILLGSSRAGFKEKSKRGAILKSLPMDLNTPNSEEKVQMRRATSAVQGALDSIG